MEHPENSSEYAGLQVNSGVKQPPIVNPYLRRNKRRELTAAEMVEGIVKGDVTVLSQAVTLIESVNPDHQAKAQEVINKCLPYSGNSVRVGISGVPGAGKSTSIDEFGIHVLKEKGGRLAVLAIDPSSERTKGSILGDKTRMEKLSREKNAFIRPSPSGGTLGGVTRKSRETLLLVEAAGYDVVLVETVGVGQSETTVRNMVDYFLMVALTGAGDDLQGIKKGIMELADSILVNKADGDNKMRALSARADFDMMLHYLRPATEGWASRAYTCSSLTGEGIPEMWAVIEDFFKTVKGNGVFERRRREQVLRWVNDMAEEHLHRLIDENATIAAARTRIEADVADGKLPPTQAAKEIIEVMEHELFHGGK